MSSCRLRADAGSLIESWPSARHSPGAVAEILPFVVSDQGRPRDLQIAATADATNDVPDVCRERHRNPGAERDPLDAAERNLDVQERRLDAFRLVDDAEFALVPIRESLQEGQIVHLQALSANLGELEIADRLGADAALLLHRSHQIRRKRLKVDDLPFLKRFPYGDEREFRIVYESKRVKTTFLDIKIPLGCIKRITLSPWIPVALTADVRNIIRGIGGCGDLQVARSTLIGNDEWKDLGDGAR